MLFSDLLAYLARPGIAPPPTMAMLPKAQTNATGASIPRAQTPPYVTMPEMMNAITQSSLAPSEIALRQAQANLAGAQGQFMSARLSALPGYLKSLQALQDRLSGATGGGASAGSADTSAGGGAAFGSLAPTTGADNGGGDPQLGLVKHFESGGDYNVGFGGADLSKAPKDATGFPIWEGKTFVDNSGDMKISHAAGAYQIQPALWHQYAPQVGVKDFSPASQDKVAAAIKADQGLSPWVPFNPRLAAAVNGSGGDTALAGAPLGAGTTPGAGMPQGASSAPQAPAFGNLGAGYRVDPLMAAIAGAGAQGEALGFPNFSAPLMAAITASPGYIAAKAGAAKAGELPFVGPTAAAEAEGKAPFSPIRINQGAAALIYNRATRRWELGPQVPKLPEGYTYEGGDAVPVPGAMQGIQASSTAQAAGPAAFRPVEVPGPYGRENLTTALGLTSMLGGAGAPPVMAPRVSGNFATGLTPPAGAPNAAAGPQPKAGSPEAATPTFPVQTLTGPKDLSALTIDDMFPGGRGIPQPPAPPPGMAYGQPSETEKEAQKDDATRLEEYQKQASGNQKIYQDLSHIRDILQAGLNTNKLAPLVTDMANIAQGLGVSALIPKGANPNDAAVFQKAATDLVFAAVKKLAGQIRVAEIEGYKQANPSIAIPIASNMNIVNDVLANGKWEDARARLAQDYVTRTGGAPLAAFDNKFNAMVPLVDVTNAYKSAFRAAGATFPEDTRKGGAAPSLPGLPRGAFPTGRTYQGKPVYQVPDGKGGFKMQVLQ